MTIFLSVIAFIVIFSLLILIHELGHFWMAKRAGIKVTEFGFGMHPKIWGKKFGETEYTINWIPFGGFVRMHGDDPNDEKLLNDPRSFVGKPLRQRIKVVIAGVVMNFLLAIVLLSFGFGFGMEPFIVTSQDAVSAIDSGLVELRYGVLIKEVEDKSVAYEVGFEPGDLIVALNGNEISNYNVIDTAFSEGTIEGFSVDIRRGSVLKNIKVDREFDESIGAEFERLVFLTHPIIKELEKDSLSELAGLKKGDVIVSINGKGIYSVSEYLDTVRNSSILNYKVLRSFIEKEVTVDLKKDQFVYVTDVGAASSAIIAGFQAGDVITKVNNVPVSSVDAILQVGGENIGKAVTYEVYRNGNHINLTATPNKYGKLGIGLAPVFYHNDYDIDLNLQVMPASITNIGKVQYPFYSAPLYAFEESWRLTKFIASTFIGMVESIVQKFTVPEGVLGPVGIARMTHVFVQAGMVALLRFMALLSLSLAVVNILPFPALDGGRLLFFVIEAICGRRINPKWESRIHALGFLLLMLLIAFITYTDIVGLFE